MWGKLTLFSFPRIGLVVGFGDGRDVRSIALALAPVQLVIAAAICSAMELVGFPRPLWPSLRSSGGGGNDFYDISYVDGFNVPITIITSNTPSSSNSHQCGNAGCPTDINTICPSELQKKDASGKVVACMSACGAFGTDQYCCSRSL